VNRTIDCSRWEELISARLDDEIGAAEEASLDEHLGSCRRCRDTALEMAALHRTFRVRSAEDIPDLSEEIIAAAAGDDLSTAPARTRRWRHLTSAAAVVLVLGGIALGGSVLVQTTATPPSAPALAQISGVATPARGGTSGAVYLEFVNDGGGDTLTGAHAANAARTSLHVTERRDGLLVMADEATRPIAAHGTTIFGPGGTHVMLNGLADDLEPGDQIEVTLQFERSGARTIAVPIVAHTELPDVYWSTSA
jgi:copper(I)-binding protein